MVRARLGAGALAGVTALSLLAVADPAHARGAPTVTHDEQITYQEWSGYRDWRGGTHQGTIALPGVRTGVTLLQGAGTTEYTDPHTGVTKTWRYGTWTSPVTRIGFDASELVASWNAETPPGTWIQV